MNIWKVYYCNPIEGKRKDFTVKASSKTQATQKAVEKVYKLLGIDDNLLNHYTIILPLN